MSSESKHMSGWAHLIVRYSKKIRSQSYLFGGSTIFDIFGTTIRCPHQGSFRGDNDNLNKDLRAIGKDLKSLLD